ncbi:transporter substrate-binding domain-containing protein [Microbulbifer taiwanensis]|uniref:Transporter substrate-binding domain-containing protein n=1 Tax=Microbulbifer taiwanensis TaxID=986746 RepID=A0ABW1YRU8_9GAMM|nr:transporter substrate-binding domain-containing protein [Microbulbifer taiwanensis]
MSYISVYTYSSSVLFLLLITIFTAGCGGSESGIESPRSIQEDSVEVASPKYSSNLYYKFKNYIETGDLEQIRKHGVIRFVNLSGASEDQLPRDDIVNLRHLELANGLARRLKLKPKWVRADTPRAAIELLLTGKADVLAFNLTDTKNRQRLVSFTIPITQTRQQLITGSLGPDISNLENLRDIEFLVPADSTSADTARRLIEKHPSANLTVREVQRRGIDQDEGADLVNEKDNRVAIIDSNVAESLSNYRDDIRLGAYVSQEENISWALRKGAEQLRLRINNYLTRNLVKPQKVRIADWKEVKESGLIRFLTYNGPSAYFLWKGVLMGFDYDLAKAFADKHNLQLQIIVVPYEETLIDWLKAGRGDFAGAAENITQEIKNQGVVFTNSYRETPEQVVSNKEKPKINNVQDLAGRTLTLRAFSSFIKTAEIIKRSGINVEVETAPPGVSVSEIFNLIADGSLDATIADNDDIRIEASVRPELDAGAIISDPRPEGWMVLPQNWELIKKLNDFLSEYRETTQYKKKVAAYFEPNERFSRRVLARIVPGQPLSPFDSLVKVSSLDYGFDWRMVTAQIWQESNFNPKAVSPVGAQGLMQVMPATAEEMGYPPPLFEPERSIKAGVKYLNWVRNRFDSTLSSENRLWFTLAAYNAGYGHLLDARRLAKKLNLDPDVWFGNVEVAMLKLAEPQYYNKARYGYVRGAEPVQYVRNISNLYKAYVDVASGEVTVRPPMRKKQNIMAEHQNTVETRVNSSAPAR